MTRHTLLHHTLTLLTGLLLPSACVVNTWEDEVMLPTTPATTPTTHTAVTGDRYVNLRLVNGSATRATEAQENAIYDGILCIFEGNSESDATLKTAVVIDQLILNPGTSSPASVTITQRLNASSHPYTDGKQLYALALLNTTAAGFSVGTDGSLRYTLPGAASATAMTGGLDDIRTKVINGVGSTDEHVGLFMANKKRDDNTYLVPITAGQLFDTPDQAASAAAITITVERAAAKVTVNNDATTALKGITLDGNTAAHPFVHRMAWALNGYNTRCNAIDGANAPGYDARGPVAFSATDFSLYPQRALSGDDMYVAENSDEDHKTQIIVELQLKNGSILLGDCFRYGTGDNTLYTSPASYLAYLKTLWTSTLKSETSYTAIASKTADDVFRNAKLVVTAVGQPKIELSNSTFTAEEASALAALASALSASTTLYREGKVYYTFTLPTVDRNTHYTLSITSTVITTLGSPTP